MVKWYRIIIVHYLELSGKFCFDLSAICGLAGMEESDPKSAREVILEDYLGTVSYAKDILQLLSSEDLLERTVSRVEIMNEIKREMTESSKCLADTTKSM